MSLFLYDKVICPNCYKSFTLKWHQKIMHIVRIGNKKLLICPYCKKLGMCEGYNDS